MTEPYEQVLEILEQEWIKRPLSSLEKFVFAQSWQGLSYEQIAASSGYSLDYMKQIGSLLWVDLSRAVSKSITKKNLRLTLEPLILKGLGSDRLSSSPLSSSPLTASYPTAKLDSLRRFPSGPLPLDSPLYIERPPIEQTTYDELLRDGCLLRIKAPRRMGKSSLLKRLMWQAQQHEYHVVTLDCQEANEELLANTEIFLQWFCRYKWLGEIKYKMI